MKIMIPFAILMISSTLVLAEGKAQTTCPVMGGPVNRALYTEVEGYRIYVCCRGCLAAVQADPAGYIARMRAAGVEPEPVPGPDPVK
jgi:hypothetical protein